MDSMRGALLPLAAAFRLRGLEARWELYHIAEKWVKVPAEALELSLTLGRAGLSGLPLHQKPARRGSGKGWPIYPPCPMAAPRALKSAVRWGLASQNVCDSVEVPRKVPYRIQPLTVEQTQTLLDAVRGHPNEALFVLAVATGMRRSELAGLKWQDVDLEKGELHVRRSLVRVPTKMGGGYMEAEPKKEKSRRSILFPDFALEALKAHRERQQEIKRQAGSLWQEYDYVFCTPLGEHIHPGHDILEVFKTLLKRAGLPDVRFHDLRHGAATLLLGMGIHPKIVQERLGHHDIGTTMDTYSHVLPTMQEGVMRQLNNLLQKRPED